MAHWRANKGAKSTTLESYASHFFAATMVAARRAFVVATWLALALGRSESLPVETSSEQRNRKSGVTKNRNLGEGLDCETGTLALGVGVAMWLLL